ncbi:hypothetical protein L1M59_11485 [Bacillus sp. ET1]|nr:hypothetical protein [Bacillus sp. ET1]
MRSLTVTQRIGVKNDLIVNQPNISNLQNCVEDVRKAALTNLEGPADPTDYHELRGRLEAVRDKLPPLYRESVYNPFIKVLDELGPTGFTQVLLKDPRRVGMAALMLDIAQAILQNGEGYNRKATDAFQEIVSDLYDGFLSSEDRCGVKPPDITTIPALVKWGNPNAGPYTWPADATSTFRLKAAIVSLPPINASRGLLAWASIPHEVCGHNILHADTGLMDEVRTSLEEQNMPSGLSDYWASRIDETASDILGILNLGPAAAIGLVGYFRGLRAAFGGEPTLSNEGPKGDPHAADILRGYLGAYAVGLLEFKQASEWAKVIEEETDKDLSEIRLGGITVSEADAKKSAQIVASTIMKTKLMSLEKHSLDQIQNWRNEDEEIVTLLRPLLNTTGSLPDVYRSGFYAAHVVAAAVTEAISKDSDIDLIFDRMLSLLKDMHDTNPSWGPLFVKYPGNIVRHLIYPI